LKNLLLICFAFLCNFIAFGGTQSLQSSLNYQEGLGMLQIYNCQLESFENRIHLFLIEFLIVQPFSRLSGYFNQKELNPISKLHYNSSGSNKTLFKLSVTELCKLGRVSDEVCEKF